MPPNSNSTIEADRIVFAERQHSTLLRHSRAFRDGLRSIRCNSFAVQHKDHPTKLSILESCVWGKRLSRLRPRPLLSSYYWEGMRAQFANSWFKSPCTDGVKILFYVNNDLSSRYSSAQKPPN